MMRRLQVLLDEEEYSAVRSVAERQRLTVAEWVRQALRDARVRHAESIEARLRAIEKAARYEAPTADIKQMLEEIAAGREAS